MKVQFGSGGNHLEGWANHDIEVDITSLPLPYADDSVDQIQAEHVCEHTTGPQFLRFLMDCHRILVPSLGVIRVCCPVIGQWMTREQAIDLTVNHGHLQVLNEDVMRNFLWMAGFDPQRIRRTDRWPIDGHWRVIGEPQDAEETCRMIAIK